MKWSTKKTRVILIISKMNVGIVMPVFLLKLGIIIASNYCKALSQYFFLHKKVVTKYGTGRIWVSRNGYGRFNRDQKQDVLSLPFSALWYVSRKNLYTVFEFKIFLFIDWWDLGINFNCNVVIETTSIFKFELVWTIN